ncbi:MAG TPA: hypothetical protein GXX75_25875 [Clostridiales bacterium]|nr:hypothetical protein [Clostridiales bacterium]
MVSEMVTYIGLDSFDLILYQACVLAKMQKKVLIIEDSKRMERCPFTSMLPVPKGVDERKEIITFRRIDFALFLPEEECLHAYDTVFISAGYSGSPYDLDTNREVYVTDLFTCNMEAVKRIMCKSACPRRSLVIRNNVFSSVCLDLLDEEMEGMVDGVGTEVIHLNENDHFNALLCQNGESFKFKLLSAELKKYLVKELGRLCPEADKRWIHTAYRAASRGGVT